MAMTGQSVITLFLLLGLMSCGNGPVSSDPTDSSVTESSTTTTLPTTPPTSQTGDVPLPLLDREWTAVAWITIAGPQPISGPGSILSFNTDGWTYVTTPCNNGSGMTVIEDGTISVTNLVTTRKACIDEELANAETQLLELLSHPLTWWINDGELILTPVGASDSGLVLRG